MRTPYPALNQLRAGNAPKPTVDAIGRRVLRVDQEKQNIGDLPEQQGGMPQVRGPEHMVPKLLEAAQEMRLPPGQATTPAIMQRIQALGGGVPQRMAGALGTSDPKQQAMAILRRSLASGGR